MLSLPDYSDKPLQRNPYFLIGGGMMVLAVGFRWWSSRKVPVEIPDYQKPPDAPPQAIAVSDITYTPQQLEAFKLSLPKAGQPYAEMFMRAGSSMGVPPVVLAGIMATESAFGNGCRDAACRGFAGNDYGLMQINSKAHPVFFKKVVNGRPAYEDPWSSIEYGAKVLRDSMKYIEQKTGLKDAELLFAGVAGYNAGPGAVVKALNKGKSADAPTYGSKYAKTVMGRVEDFVSRANATVG